MFEVGIFDLSLGIIFTMIIFFIALLVRKKRIDSDPTYKFLMPALSIKMVSGIVFLIMYLFYYGGGDTFVYYKFAHGLSELILSSPLEGIKILFSSPESFNPNLYEFSNWWPQYFENWDTLTMVKITAVVNLLSFNSYLVTTLFFSSFSFSLNALECSTYFIKTILRTLLKLPALIW